MFFGTSILGLFLEDSIESPLGGSPPPPRVWLSLPLVAEQGRSNCEANISSIVCPYVHYERPNLRHLDMSFCTATYCTCPGFHQERLFVCCGYNESYNEKWGKTVLFFLPYFFVIAMATNEAILDTPFCYVKQQFGYIKFMYPKCWFCITLPQGHDGPNVPSGRWNLFKIIPNEPPNLQKVTQNGTKIDQNRGLRPPKRR